MPAVVLEIVLGIVVGPSVLDPCSSRSLATARSAWSASGHTVIGAALAARAAKELQEQSGIPSSTINRMLGDLDQTQGALRPRSVMVIDEAGMVGTRQLARLLAHAQTTNAKVVLIGDPHQLPEIDGGGALAGLARRLPTITLTDNRRQRDPTERHVLTQLRTGEQHTPCSCSRRTGASPPRPLPRIVVPRWSTTG